MRSDVKDKWVAALRSGEFEQGVGLLRSREDKYCCLGVLCELAVAAAVVEAGVLVPWDTTVTSDERYAYGGEGAVGSLPDGIMEWAETQTSEGWIGETDESLSAMNDTGHSFAEIADIIEKNWKEL